jgi:polysaccharide chain length determinant protein (PEP-CTERM system associated)
MQEQLTQIYGYLHGMWCYRWMALFITWGVALAGGLFVMTMPDQFSSKAVVYIDTTSVMKPLLKGLALETDSRDELQVMSRVMLSRENLLAVIRETDMDLEVESPQAREKLVQQLARTISVSGGGRARPGQQKSNIYEISYQSISADRSFRVVSNLLNTMIEDTLNSTRTDTVTAQKFLDVQIAEYERRLVKSEQQLAEFKKANVGYMPDEKGGYYVRLQREQDTVESTRSALVLAERTYAELNKQLKGEKPLLDRESYESAKVTKLRQYREQLDDLLNQFTEQHPDVKAVRAIIADLEASDDDSGGVASSSGSDEAPEFNPVYQAMKVDLSKAGVEIETLKIQLAASEARVKKLRDSIDVIPEVEAELSKLNRDYEITRGRYLDLVERRESARLAQSAGQNTSDITFRVIEPPIVPLRPSGPNRLLLLTGVLVAALGAGLGWSFLRYLLQPTFIDSQQARQSIGLPVFGSVSLHISPEHRQKRRTQLITFLSAVFMLVCVYGVTVYTVL